MKTKRFKQITRIYTKKDGTQVVRTYSYRVKDGKHERVKTGYGATGKHKLLNKNGKKTKYFDQYVDSIKNNKDLSSDEKRSLINELNAYTEKYRREGKALTNATFESHMIDNSVDRFIYNLGGDIEQVSEELGISEEDLRNPYNWDFQDNTFTINGMQYMFSFDYDNGGVSWKLR